MAKKDLFSPGSLKKVDKKLLTAALVRSRQPTSKPLADVKRKSKRDVDNIFKNKKTAKDKLKFIGNVLRKNAQDRRLTEWEMHALDRRLMKKAGIKKGKKS